MRTSLTVLTDELRRLKGAGVKTVSVSPDTIVALRRALVKTGGSEESVEEPASAVQRRAISPAPRSMPPASGTSGPLVPAAPPPPPPPPVLAAAPRPPIEIVGSTKQEKWNHLRDRVLNDPECRKHVRPGKKVVLGVGSLDARIMFVGEAPGGEEEIQGEPFVGPAGQLLTKMIQAMGLLRSDVYIGNIMNWRPEMELSASGEQFGNRPPTAEEMAYCLPHLRAQIDIVAPGYLVALGATAAQGLLGPGAFKALGEVRGRWKDFQGRPLMITYHPSYILRNNSNKSKRLIWEDLLQVMDRAELPVSDKQRGYFLDK
jgi:uracil-DNA glycosylase family 4